MLGRERKGVDEKMSDSDKLEQLILQNSVKTLGSAVASDAYYRFHVLYGEKHKKVLINSGHDSVLLKIARNYYGDRALVYSRYMSVNYGVGRKPFLKDVEGEEDQYKPKDYRVMM